MKYIVIFATIFVYVVACQILISFITDQQAQGWWFCGGWFSYIAWNGLFEPFLASKFPNLFGA